MGEASLGRGDCDGVVARLDIEGYDDCEGGLPRPAPRYVYCDRA